MLIAYARNYLLFYAYGCVTVMLSDYFMTYFSTVGIADYRHKG